MRKSCALFSIFLFFNLIFPNYGFSEPLTINQINVDHSSVRSASYLVKKSNMIIVGTIEEDLKKFPTKRHIEKRAIINYVQTIHVNNVLKGSNKATIPLLTDGLEPLPKHSNPLNNEFTGPLASGPYVFFLRHIEGTEMYSLVGIWQGLYPIIENKTVVLNNMGFPQFQQLTIQQMQQQIKDM